VLTPGAVVNQDVVEEHQDTAAEKRVQDIIHECLECRWGIGEPERHDQELKVTMVSPERCFFNVIRVHADLMVSTAKIQLGEEYSAL
jgi:hypothetical protein